ncbi:MAG: hypothetical protein EPN25_11985 [Nitrospirae bacterium]|nr:MAG: hypothetical protein EPN25_11985 [Nitrospirota bacterium]
MKNRMMLFKIIPAIAIVLCLTAGQSWAAASYLYSDEWGTPGAANSQFSLPSGAAVDAGGNIYVADEGNNRIQKFGPAGTFTTSYSPGLGSANGQFNGPRGIAVDAAGNVYVTDFHNNRVQKFNNNFQFQLAFGSAGQAAGQFTGPSGIALDSLGNIYVTDSINDRVQKFDSSGAFLIQWGSNGPADGQFFEPQGIAVDVFGSVYVVDTFNDRIQKFDSNGVFLGKWGIQGSANAEFFAPVGLALDAAGNLYVTDAGNLRVQKFTGGGTFFTTWGAFGQLAGEFIAPSGIAVSSTGSVYAADTLDTNVQIFGPSVPFVAAPKAGVYIDGLWYLDKNGNGAWDGSPADLLFSFGGGIVGAIPVTGDWDASGRTEVGIYDNGSWYLDNNGNGIWEGAPTDIFYSFGGGLTGAVPVTGDWDGDGKTEIGIYADGLWYLDRNGNGQWEGSGADLFYSFGGGLTGAVPVVGDWNGDGTDEIGLYLDGTWYLDVNGNGAWDGEPVDRIESFGGGLTGAVPVAGGWSQDGVTEIGVYFGGSWYLDFSASGAWDGTTFDQFYIYGVGLTGAVPVTGNW